MIGGSADHAPVYTADAPRTNNTLWSVDISSGDSSPIIGYVDTIEENVAFITTSEGSLLAYSMSGTGGGENKPLWDIRVGSPDGSTPAFANGFVYVLGGPEADILYKVNGANGSIEWGVTVGATHDGVSPIISDGKVVVASGGIGVQGCAYSIEAVTGVELWKDCPKGGGFVGTATVYEGNVFIPWAKDPMRFLRKNGVRMYHLSNGQALSTGFLETGYSDQTFSIMAAADNVLYMSQNDRNLYAFSLGQMKTLWNRTFTSLTGHESATVRDDILYMGAGPDGFVALSTADGSMLWQVPGIDGTGGIPLVADDMVYFHSDMIYAFDASPGDGIDDGVTTGGNGSYDIVWTYRLDGAAASSPALGNGRLVARGRGLLAAFYGLSMDVVPLSQTKVFITRQGGNATFNVSIRNTGDLQDTYTLTLGGDAEGWTAGIDGWGRGPFDVALDPGENHSYSILVSTPPTLLEDASMDFYLFAVSTTERGIQESIKLSVQVSILYSVSLYTVSPLVWVSPGETASFNVTVENVGNVPDTFDISVSLQSIEYSGDRWYYLGWRPDTTVSVNRTMVTLDEAETTTVLFEAYIPLRALPGERAVFRIDTWSVSEPFRSHDELLLTVGVLPYTEVSIDAPIPNVVADPGESVRFVLDMDNTGNTDQRVIMNVTPVNDTWDDELWLQEWVGVDGYVTLPSGERVRTVLEVTVPENVTGGMTVSWDVRPDLSSKVLVDPVRLSITVRPVHEVIPHWPVTIAIPLEELSSGVGTDAHGGDVFGMELDWSMEDTGNAPETVEVRTLAYHEGWEFTLPGNRTDTVISLNASETSMGTANLTIPRNAGVGTYSLFVETVPDSPGNDSFKATYHTIQVEVPHRRDLTVSIFPDSVTGLPGMDYRVQVVVTNRGNAPEFVVLSASFIEQGGAFFLPPGAMVHREFAGSIDNDATSATFTETMQVSVATYLEIPAISSHILTGEAPEWHHASGTLWVMDTEVPLESHSSEVITVDVRVPELQFRSIDWPDEEYLAGALVPIRVMVVGMCNLVANSVSSTFELEAMTPPPA